MEKEKRLKGTQFFKYFAIWGAVVIFIIGLLCFSIFKVEKPTLYSVERVYNTSLLIYFICGALCHFITFNVIYNVLYRLDLIIDKKSSSK